MKIWRFENFIALVKAGSINAAAEQLHISPQALHQQMDTLENEVGCKLLVRSRKGVTLTEAGSVFYSRIGKLVKDYRQLVEDTIAAEQRAKNTVCSMASTLFTDHLFVHALVEFKKQYPEILPTIASAEHVDSDTAEVIVNDLLYPSDSYALFSSVMTDCFIHVQSTHRLAKYKQVRIEDLYGETLMVNTPHLLDQLNLSLWNRIKQHTAHIAIESLAFQGALNADTMVLSTNQPYLCWGISANLHPSLRQIRIEDSRFEYKMLYNKKKYKETQSIRIFLEFMARYYKEHWQVEYDRILSR